MQSHSSETIFKRITTFDLLRIFFAISIVMLHTWEHFVGEDIPSFPLSLSFYEIYRQVVGTVLNYAALYVLSLSFFIWGLKGLKMQWTKFLIFILGFLGLQLKDPENPFSLDSWVWDVYGYLFFAVLFCRFYSKKYIWNLALILFSVVMLSIPLDVWQPFADQTVHPWRSILFSEIDGRSIGGWFLIPWLFISTLSYSSGVILAQRKDLFDWIQNKAWILCGFLLAGSALCFLIKPAPIVPQLGDHFYQFLFMQSPLHFWNHFLVFIAVLIFCLKIENTDFIRNSFLKYLSYLQWNRNFFLCYFFHFALIVFFLRWKEQILEIPYGIDVLWIVIFISTEIMMQLFVGSLKVYGKVAVWFIQRFKAKPG